MKFKDPRNKMMFYGILIHIVGIIVVILMNKINILAFGLSMFGSLFIATSLVYRLPFVVNYIKKTNQKRKEKR